jgi:hypothetical protein
MALAAVVSRLVTHHITRISGARSASSLPCLFSRSQRSADPALELYVPRQRFRFNTKRLTPLTQVCLFRFRISYCLPSLISFPTSPSTLALQSDPKVACHFPGSHEVLPPPPFVSHEIWISICSVLVNLATDGFDAMRPCGASQLSSITRPSYY